MSSQDHVPRAIKLVEISEMDAVEISSMLERAGYGHLGCAKDDRPYVIPIHYVYDSTDIYIFTTAGKKSELISANSEVCLQVEEVRDDRSWKSVIVQGRAELLADSASREKASRLLDLIHPNHTPALGHTVVAGHDRENKVEIYRIKIEEMSGRMAHHR